MPVNAVPREVLARYLHENQGTEGLRALRERLIADGIPLDRSGPTRLPGAGPPKSADPADRLRETMRWVASSDQYDISTANGFLANAATAFFASAARPDGSIHVDDVEQKLGKEARALFSLIVSRMEEGRSRPAEAPPPALPGNALGVRRRSPDAGPLKIPPEIMRRIPFKMRVADLNHFAKLRAALAARSERRDPARRIAAQMTTPMEVPKIPALEELRAQAKVDKPLQGAKLLVLQHLYASTQSILDAAVDAGVAPSDVTVMGKPYSGSMKAAASMLRSGYNLVVPSLHQSEFSDHDEHMNALVVEQVSRLLAEPGKGPILVVDDGGHVAKIVAKQFPRDVHRFKFVEQTQRGANVVREQVKGLQAPVVNVAESDAKKGYESPSIAHSVFKETKAVLDRLQGEGVVVQREMTVLGYGSIGAAAAKKFAAEGWTVHVYDPDPDRQRAARDAGLAVHEDKAEALKHAHVLVGATGREAVRLDDVRHLPKHAILFNAASANNELNATNQLVWQMMAGNALQGTVRIGPRGVEVPRELLFSLDTSVLDEEGRLWDVFQGKDVCLGRDESATQIDRVVHTADGHDLYFAHAGFVINLTDDDDPIPPRYIGLTRSLLYAALLQAAGETRTGLVDLDPAVQQRIVDTTERALQNTGESLLDPRF